MIKEYKCNFRNVQESLFWHFFFLLFSMAVICKQVLQLKFCPVFLCFFFLTSLFFVSFLKFIHVFSLFFPGYFVLLSVHNLIFFLFFIGFFLLFLHCFYKSLYIPLCCSCSNIIAKFKL